MGSKWVRIGFAGLTGARARNAAGDTKPTGVPSGVYVRARAELVWASWPRVVECAERTKWGISKWQSNNAILGICTVLVQDTSADFS
jgi:hypothetical protein